MNEKIFSTGSANFKKKQKLAIEALSMKYAGTILVSTAKGNSAAVNDRGFTTPTDDPVILAAYTSNGYNGWVAVSRVKEAVLYDSPDASHAIGTHIAYTRSGKPLYGRSASGYSGAAVNVKLDGTTRNMASTAWPRDALDLTLQEFVDLTDFILPN